MKIIEKFKLEDDSLVVVGISELPIREIKNLNWFASNDTSKQYLIQIIGENFLKTKSKNENARAFLIRKDDKTINYLLNIKGHFEICPE